jgi:hypothetical protein
MSAAPVNGVANSPLIACHGPCGRSRPPADFYPSMLRQHTYVCKDCQRLQGQQKRDQRARGLFDTLAGALGADGPWTSEAAAGVLGLQKLGMSAVWESLVRRGLVRRIEAGVYAPGGATETPPMPPAPSSQGPRLSSSDPQFLEVGTHVFSPPFTIIQDDRGRAAVILPVAETDARTGHTAPLTVNFTAEEWAARRVVTMTDIVNGGRVDLFERVTELERDNDRLRKEAARERADKEAAMALAEESAQKLARFRAAAAAL